jgi:hypothetical protein
MAGSPPMPRNFDGPQPDARMHAEEMLHAIASAEHIIVSAIERECEALRAGRMLAAQALHTQLRDGARAYLNATRAAKASIALLKRLSPGMCDRLEERRAAFASLLKVELAVLATERAVTLGTHDGLSKVFPPSAAPRKTARLVAVSGGASRKSQRAS